MPTISDLAVLRRGYGDPRAHYAGAAGAWPRPPRRVLSRLQFMRHTERMNKRKPQYHSHRAPPQINGHAVCWNHQFCLNLRDVEDLLPVRGLIGVE